MSDYIRRFPTSEPYVPIWRRILHYDHSVHSEQDAVYHRDVSVGLSKKDKRAFRVEHEEFTVPEINVSAHWKIKQAECQFNLWDAARERAKDAWEREMDRTCLAKLNAAAPLEHQVSTSGGIHPDGLALALGLIAEHSLTPSAIIVPPKQYEEIASWGSPQYRAATAGGLAYVRLLPPDPKDPDKMEWKDAHAVGIRGFWRDIPIYSTPSCRKDRVYVLGPSTHLGVCWEGEDDGPTSSGEGDRCVYSWEPKAGMFVVNDYAVTTVKLWFDKAYKSLYAEDERLHEASIDSKPAASQPAG